MKFTGTDVMAVGLIATCGAAGLAFSIAIAEGGSSVSSYTVTTDFETAQEVVVGERVERIRTDASGVYVERTRVRHEAEPEGDDLNDDLHVEREIEVERRSGEAGATVIRIRGDADATSSEGDVRIRESNRVRIQADGEAPQPLIYVDGTRFEGDFDALNPDDIDRIEVVKGAAAIELYGEAADGGVIRIFTKNGTAPNPGR